VSDIEEVCVAPSVLAADFGNLTGAMDEVASSTPWIHLDVMDGHFVPNITIGPPVVASLRKHSDAYFDCHLMIENPGSYLEAFRDAGANSTTVHVEVGDTSECIAQMRELGLGVGVALNPDTPLSMATEFLGDIDLLLLMTVFPGFGGQHFIAEVVPKITEASNALVAHGHHYLIEVDGGIFPYEAALSAGAGARVFVAGTAVFRSSHPADAVDEIRSAALEAIARATTRRSHVARNDDRP